MCVLNSLESTCLLGCLKRCDKLPQRRRNVVPGTAAATLIVEQLALDTYWS